MLAAAVRLWGIDYGLACTYCRPDEDRLIATALRLSSVDLNPHYFIWPGLFFYLTRSILEVATWGYRLVAGSFIGSSRDLYVADPAYFHLVLRYIFCGFGVATICLIYRLGHKLFSSTVGFLSAFFLALTFLHVRDSHFAMLDIPATLLGVASLLAAWTVCRRGRWRDYLLAGVLLGLAMATKYYAVILTIPLITAYLSRRDPSTAYSGSGKGTVRLLISVTIAAIIFILVSPYTLLDFSAFLREIRTGIISPQLVDGFHLLPDLNTDRGWLYHITFSLRYGLGWPLEILALMGVGYAVWRAFKGAIPERLILSFVLPFYLVLAFQKSCFIRYTTLLLPFLCLLGAVLLLRIIPRHRFRGLFLVGAVLLLVLEPSVRIVQLDRLLSRPDTRLIAGTWMKDHISPESGVIFLQPTIFGRPDEFFSYPNRISLPDWAGTEMFRGLLSSPVPEKKYVVISEHSLSYSDLNLDMKILLEEESEEIYTIKGGGEGNQDVIYDPFDAFYLPLAGFGGVNFPGPGIRVFYLNSALPAESSLATYLHRRDAESAEED